MILCGDAAAQLQTLDAQSVDTCVTSPPYFGLRSYDADGQIGLEQTHTEYIARLVDVFREVWRVLRDDGTLWVVIGDSYCAPSTSLKGSVTRSTLSGGLATQREASKRPDKKPHGDIKRKDLIGIPWTLAFALREDGWYLRSDIIWEKPNQQPESVKDRCTRSHEYVFMLAKKPHYYFDAEAIREPAVNGDPKSPRGSKGQPKLNGGRRHAEADKPQVTTRNKRDVWTVSTAPYKGAHFATYPTDLIRPCILAGSRPGGTVLDPFCGSGTTGLVAAQEGREFIGIDINPEYCEMSRQRMNS
jgi:DNA modification methylase